MKKKNESKTPQKPKGQNTPNVDTKTGATDKSRAKSGRGMANEGTNTSYDEER
jgi:hypothetical protein